jgi:hypothetical protein
MPTLTMPPTAFSRQGARFGHALMAACYFLATLARYVALPL